jgi:polar amino acid transport system substrate-binding protein
MGSVRAAAGRRKAFPVTSLRSRIVRSLVVAGVAVALAAGCASTSSTGTSPGGLKTITAGKLTVATGKPAYAPWVIGKPQSGKGFESAVAYAVAAQLGFARKDVVWTSTDFDAAIAPGPKNFDLNIQQFTITSKRAKAVDFSSPYYQTTEALVATKGSAADGATTISALKKIKIGVAAGTTSYTIVLKDVGVQPEVFNSNDDAVLALKSGQVDAIAVDLPTAFYLADAELKHGEIIGQFADTTGGDQFGIVLAKGSSLTAKVSAAVDAIRKDGELAAITKKWLSTSVNVPVFK